MSEIKSNLKGFIGSIEKTPGFHIIGRYTYRELTSYVSGYLRGIDSIQEPSHSYNFSLWLNNKYKPTSLIWTEYILLVLANEDEDEAVKIFFKEFKGYIDSL